MSHIKITDKKTGEITYIGYDNHDESVLLFMNKEKGSLNITAELNGHTADVVYDLLSRQAQRELI